MPESRKRAWWVIGLVMTGLIIATLLTLRGYLHTPLHVPADGYTFVVERGAAFRRVADQLAQAGILNAPAVLSGYARLTGAAGRIQAGEYSLGSATTPDGLLKMLIDGRVRLHALTIVEGWTVRELLAAIRAHPAITQTLEVDAITDLNAVLELDYPHPEGLFFPDTYRFARGTTDVELLQQSHALMREKLSAIWNERIPVGVIQDPYDALILASIVERETALDAERAIVAGVFVRRLEQNMRLQTDPTVIYGLGEDFDGNLTRRDLRTDTPYNTYTRRGLPPTPIALPGLKALQAVARPEDGDALYFVATGRGDGSHKFTATLEEHNAAVAEYLAMLRKRQQ